MRRAVAAFGLVAALLAGGPAVSQQPGPVVYEPEKEPATAVGRATAAAKCRGGFNSTEYWREFARQEQCVAESRRVCQDPPRYCRAR